MVTFKSVISIILLTVFLVRLNTLAQNFNCVIQGKITAQSTRKSLENVNVYISGTTFGSTTDKHGIFRLESVPAGTHTLVASIVGYKSENTQLTLKEGMKIEISFNLKEINYQLNNVFVVGKIPTEWRENLEKFKDHFFGESPFTSECKIVNPEVINFVKTDSNLIAKADQLITINNNDLGYKITCNLIKFNWNEDDGVIKYLIESYFTELKDSTGNLTNSWIKNRRKAYDGSLDNFLKSLIDNKLSDNGFKIYIQNSPSLKIISRKQIYESEIIFFYNKQITLNFDDYLRVQYFSNKSGISKISWIKLLRPNILLDTYGYPLDPLAFEVYGDWSHMGMSIKLPRYYKP